MQIEYQIDALPKLLSLEAINLRADAYLKSPWLHHFSPRGGPYASPESITASVPSQTELPQQDENPKTRMPRAYEFPPFKRVLQKMLQSI